MIHYSALAYSPSLSLSLSLLRARDNSSAPRFNSFASQIRKGKEKKTILVNIRCFYFLFSDSSTGSSSCLIKRTTLGDAEKELMPYTRRRPGVESPRSVAAAKLPLFYFLDIYSESEKAWEMVSVCPPAPLRETSFEPKAEKEEARTAGALIATEMRHEEAASPSSSSVR